MAGELIVIVEDDPKNFKLFKDLLEMKGYRIIGAHDGKQAIEVLGSTKPDLILMDLLLPDVNGLEVVTLLKAKPETRDIPVFALTSLAMEDDREVPRHVIHVLSGTAQKHTTHTFGVWS